MPTLPNAAAESVACLKNSDFGATLQKNVGTSQASKSSSNNADTNLFRYRHGSLEHAFRVDVLIRV